MDIEESEQLIDLCFDADKRILKQYGYYYGDHVETGKRPEDLEDVDMAEVERIATFLKTHPIYPKKKIRKKVNYKSFHHDITSKIEAYYLGNSYSLKHIVERFLTPLPYCANGDFIAACLKVGFLVAPEADSPNAEIYIPCERVRAYERYYIAV